MVVERARLKLTAGESVCGFWSEISCTRFERHPWPHGLNPVTFLSTSDSTVCVERSYRSSPQETVTHCIRVSPPLLANKLGGCTLQRCSWMVINDRRCIQSPALYCLPIWTQSWWDSEAKKARESSSASAHAERNASSNSMARDAAYWQDHKVSLYKQFISNSDMITINYSFETDGWACCVYLHNNRKFHEK